MGYPLLLLLLALLSSIRILWLSDVFMDDNCWLRVIRETDGLVGFLEHSFGPMHRATVGAIFYAFLSQYDDWWFYPLWHGATLLTEIGSPLVLYALVHKLNNDKRLAFVCAACLIVLKFDHTLGYLSGINYRFGLLFGLLSLYATVSARHGYAWVCMVLALASTETALAIEPARLYMLWQAKKSRPRAVLCVWWPFLLLSVALVGYKLVFPPVGMWQNSYIFNTTHLVKNALSLPYFETVELWGSLSYQTVTPWVLGLLAIVLVRIEGGNAYHFHSLSLTLILSSLVLLLYADRELGGSMNSSHVAVMQIGTSLLAGCWLARRPVWVFALVVFLGTVANNKYIDLYFQSWQAQEQFWVWFHTEHPTVKATDQFYMDVQDGAVFSDLRTYCDFEAGFQERYGVRPQVYTREQAVNDVRRGRAIFDQPRFEQETHLGMESFETKAIQWIRYRHPVHTAPRLPDRTSYDTRPVPASPRSAFR